MPPTRRTFLCGSVRLAADTVEGAGTPWVFFHGLASSRLGLKGNALVEFAEHTGRTLHRVDLRGHGESDGSLATTTVSDLRDDVLCVLREVGPAVVIGSSLGGLIAAWAAASEPDSVRALALIAPAVGLLSKLRPDTPWLGSGDPLPIGDHVLDDARSYDESALPKQLSMPVSIVHGALDPVVAAADVQRLYDAVPHTHKSLWMIDGGDHGLGEHFPEILESTARFCDEHTGD